ncbi:MAG: ribosome silencing factor [Prevotella sp.]|nr:ribosome silencing factor [Prevotella sp.]
MTNKNQLVEKIIEGIQEKKGSKIVVVDLNKVEGTITNYFVICQGNSPTQVEAIAESVADFVRKDLKEKPISAVGIGSSQWVAIDFVDVMVHVFLPEMREFYDLEHLWADADITEIPDLD